MIWATSGSDSWEQYFVEADNVEIKVSAKSIKAFDVLKLHHCFDVKFAPDLKIFYNFICAIVMNMKSVKNCPASVTLGTSLRNINDSHLLERYVLHKYLDLL
ncbi:hypothetical protein QAD02_010418 [Eretmocerus hayati]|uniref:Uncharacterized protein n=1 Tax=Eretmocerus hayati TaxID=131215 RepID=A0ACC2NU31_9HYME|nr:hypothetical protein QAD02_010418 [Eretmocerus hayati]